MISEQRRWFADGWRPAGESRGLADAQMALVFGSRGLLEQQARIDEIQAAYPTALLLGCSTAGEICGAQVSEESLATTAVRFAHATAHGAQMNVEDAADSFEVGCSLARTLAPQGLVHVFVLSDGLRVNGSELVRGLTSCLPPGVTVTGGLSADGADFARTLVLWGDRARAGSVAALGFYGARLRVGFGSLGGWDSFGPDRLVTRARGNVVYELDGMGALDLYKKYLGDHAKGLPATGLLFPLAVRSENQERGVVRTILAVNEEDGSMTFAGDVPEGCQARLMKANLNRLIDGAAGAAQTCAAGLGAAPAELAVLISCVGRRMVLKQRTEEEVEGVRDALAPGAALTGFYSYGEICPFAPAAPCELHNQTMTVTAFAEV